MPLCWNVTGRVDASRAKTLSRGEVRLGRSARVRGNPRDGEARGAPDEGNSGRARTLLKSRVWRRDSTAAAVVPRGTAR